MKTFKRISAIAISLCMIISSMFSTVAFAATGMTDVNDDHIHYKAIADLVDKGIITGYEDGSFKPEGNITRAEFCAIIARADAPSGFVFASTNSRFADVAANAAWATGYVEYASSRGIVNGFEDGTFRPNDPVTYAQAVKMVVCALNYGFAAEATTPWYQTYITLATQLNLLKNAMGSVELPAPRSLVAQLVYNMNGTPPAVQTGTDKDGNPIYTVSDTTKEQETNDTETVEGVLLSVFRENITTDSFGLNKKEALILVDDDEEVYEIGNYTVEEIAEYMGYEVKITYSENDSGKNVIQKISKTSINDIYTIKDIELLDVTSDTVEFLDDDAKNGVAEMDIESDAYVIVNGEVVSNPNLRRDLSIDSGEITIIDNDGNGKGDVVFVKKYITVFVGTKTQSGEKYSFFDKLYDTKKYVFDGESDDIVVKLMANGGTSLTDGTLAGIAASNVISIAFPGGDEITDSSVTNPITEAEIIVSKKTASGTSAVSEIKSIDNNRKTVKIGDKTFDMSNYYYENAYSDTPVTTYPQQLSVGDSCSVYLDFTGKIAAVNKKEASTLYGYIVKIGKASGNALDDDEEYIVRMYDSSGKMKDRVPVATKGFKLNGSSADGEDLKNAIEAAASELLEGKEFDSNNSVNAALMRNAAQAVLVKYELSGDTLKSVYVVDNDDDNAIKARYVAGTDKLIYDSNTFKLGGQKKFTISSSTKVVVVTFDGTATTYSVKTGTSFFTKDKGYIIDAFDGAENSPAKAVVVYGDRPEIKAGSDTIFVKGLETTMNEENEVVQELTYCVMGSTAKEETIMGAESDTFEGVEVGDIIKILKSGDKAEQVMHLIDADASDEDDKLIPDYIESVGGTFKSNGILYHKTGTTEYEIFYGTVTLRPGDAEGAGGEIMSVIAPGVDDGVDFKIATSTDFIKYLGADEEEVFDFDAVQEDIIDTTLDSRNPSKVVVIRISGLTKAVVIYE